MTESKCGCKKDQKNNDTKKEKLLSNSPQKKSNSSKLTSGPYDLSAIAASQFESQIITDLIDSNTSVEKARKNNKHITEPQVKDVVMIEPEEKSELSEKDYSIIDPETNELGEKSDKGGKNYYYTQPETNLLKDIKKLFKRKLKRKHKICSKSIKEDKIPENDCRIKVEAWEKHDKEKCTAEDKDYKLIGELLFPVCSKELFYQAPGVPIRNSQKSYTLNDPDKFGKPELEKREYAYAEKIIPTCMLEWTDDDQKELEEWIELHPGTSRQVGHCNMCK